MALQREDWVQAAFRRLAKSGVESVRVELLARDLGATKGSFYWHFKDRAELLAAVLDQWESEHERIQAAVAQEPTPTRRIDRFLQLITAPAADPAGAALENAMFSWAARDRAVAKRVATLEARRTAGAIRLLEELGFEPNEAAWWGETGYTMFVGMMNRAARDPSFRRRPQVEYLRRIVEAAQSLARSNKRRRS